MTQQETTVVHLATVTAVEYLAPGKHRIDMNVDQRSFQVNLPKDRIMVGGLGFTKQENDTGYSIQVESFIGLPGTGQQVLVELCPGRDTVNLHWKLPPKEPELPVSLVLWCQVENRTRTFGLRYGSTYDCPCGQFFWDVFNQEGSLERED